MKEWLRYNEVPLVLGVEAVVWTEHAIAIQWCAREGEHRAWVRTSAVRAR
jgi:hypothetical protein